MMFIPRRKARRKKCVLTRSALPTAAGAGARAGASIILLLLALSCSRSALALALATSRHDFTNFHQNHLEKTHQHHDSWEKSSLLKSNLIQTQVNLNTAKPAHSITTIREENLEGVGNEKYRNFGDSDVTGLSELVKVNASNSRDSAAHEFSAHAAGKDTILNNNNNNTNTYNTTNSKTGNSIKIIDNKTNNSSIPTNIANNKTNNSSTTTSNKTDNSDNTTNNTKTSINDSYTTNNKINNSYITTDITNSSITTSNKTDNIYNTTNNTNINESFNATNNIPNNSPITSNLFDKNTNTSSLIASVKTPAPQTITTNSGSYLTSIDMCSLGDVKSSHCPDNSRGSATIAEASGRNMTQLAEQRNCSRCGERKTNSTAVQANESFIDKMKIFAERVIRNENQRARGEKQRVTSSQVIAETDPGGRQIARSAQLVIKSSVDRNSHVNRDASGVERHAGMNKNSTPREPSLSNHQTNSNTSSLVENLPPKSDGNKSKNEEKGAKSFDDDNSSGLLLVNMTWISDSDQLNGIRARARDSKRSSTDKSRKSTSEDRSRESTSEVRSKESTSEIRSKESTIVDRSRVFNSKDTSRESTTADRSRASTTEDKSKESITPDRSKESTTEDRSRESTTEDRSKESTTEDRSRESTTEDRSRESTTEDDYNSSYEMIEGDGDDTFPDGKSSMAEPSLDLGLLSSARDLAGSLLEALLERLVPQGLRTLLQRMQNQNHQLETLRLRSREENGGLGQFGRSLLFGLTSPLTQLMQGARDNGSLDADQGLLAGVASVANSLADSFKDRVKAIYPGTLWCGDGDMARSAEVGVFFRTDSCCRRHDACRLYILAGQTKYGLTNTGVFTRSHCSCDHAFYRCLKKTNTLISTQIGVTYFSLLGPQCFMREHPIISCIRRTRLTGQKCEEYELDRAQPKMWQWFDNETF